MGGSAVVRHQVYSIGGGRGRGDDGFDAAVVVVVFSESQAYAVTARHEHLFLLSYKYSAETPIKNNLSNGRMSITILSSTL